jgi:hypothetical protein
MNIDALPRYGDAEVEKSFGISVSRLRTAQRLSVVTSGKMTVRRHIRVWRLDAILRVFMAHRFAGEGGLAFNACALALASGLDASWDAVNRCAFEGGPDLNARFRVVNRRYVTVAIPGSATFGAGEIVVEDDGRASFKLDDHRRVDDNDADQAPVVSELVFYLDPVIREFRRLYAEAA